MAKPIPGGTRRVPAAAEAGRAGHPGGRAGTAVLAGLRSMADRYLGSAEGAEFIETMRAGFAAGNGIKVGIEPKYCLSADYGKT